MHTASHGCLAKCAACRAFEHDWRSLGAQLLPCCTCTALVNIYSQCNCIAVLLEGTPGPAASASGIVVIKIIKQSPSLPSQALQQYLAHQLGITPVIDATEITKSGQVFARGGFWHMQLLLLGHACWCQSHFMAPAANAAFAQFSNERCQQAYSCT